MSKSPPIPESKEQDPLSSSSATTQVVAPANETTPLLAGPPAPAVAVTAQAVAAHLTPSGCCAKIANSIFSCFGVVVTDTETIALKLQPLAKALAPVGQALIALAGAEAHSAVAAEATKLGGNDPALTSTLQTIGATMVTGLTTAAANTTNGIVNADSVAQIKSTLASAVVTFKTMAGSSATAAVTLAGDEAQQQLNDHITSISEGNPQVAKTLQTISGTLLTGAKTATISAISGVVNADAIPQIKDILSTAAHTLLLTGASATSTGIGLGVSLADAQLTSALGSSQAGQQTAAAITSALGNLGDAASFNINAVASGTSSASSAASNFGASLKAAMQSAAPGLISAASTAATSAINSQPSSSIGSAAFQAAELTAVTSTEQTLKTIITQPSQTSDAAPAYAPVELGGEPAVNDHSTH